MKPNHSPTTRRLLSALTALLFAAGVATAEADEHGGDAAAMADEMHAKLLSEESYPSASQCKECHERIYWEWASSNHAYSSISPMFHKFEQTINTLSSGTIGSFCVRCHQQVGTQRGELRHQPLWERSQVAREGVTCITCHRVAEEYGKVNGERLIVPGDIHEPVTGSGVGGLIDEILREPEAYKVDPVGDTPRSTQIHDGIRPFDQITKSEFCVSCHQVAVHPGIKLEIVWDQYRDSPALRAGVTCQECHMGQVPGRAEGYTTAPAAILPDGTEINPDRTSHNHAFYGPGYPIAHPGIFPHNPDAEDWAIEEWLQFDWRTGWGCLLWEETLEEEGWVDARWRSGEGCEVLEETIEEADLDAVPEDQRLVPEFPEVWEDGLDREDAREVIEANLIRLEEKRDLRQQVMDNGSKIDGPFFDSPPALGESLSFSYKVTNTNSGHNLPSGSLGAQPEIWMNVALTDPDGITVWESGYVDSHGDMADLHSLDVAAGTIEHDDQLFNLQTKFLTTNVKGTDREMYLPVNFDIDQIPFIRPANVPTTVLNHPPFIRMESRSIPPLGHRFANYSVPSSAMSKPGTYKLSVRMRSRAEPIYFMKFVGATPEMEEAMNQWMIDMHPYAVEFEVK